MHGDHVLPQELADNGRQAPSCARVSWRLPLLLALSLALTACAGAGKPKTSSATAAHGSFGQSEHGSASAGSNDAQLRVTQASKLAEVLAAIPRESLLERFAAYDTQGRRIDYLAFTDTDVGGIVFINGRLAGTIARQMTQGFFICRGQHALGGRPYHWGSEAAAWLASLLTQVRPGDGVSLEFTGKTTLQSIKSVGGNPLVKGLRSVLGMGSNPFKVFNTLSDAHDQYEASEQYEREQQGLAQLQPGMSEARLVEVIKPQYLAFVPGGMLLGYPSHRTEYFITDGSIRVIQQPELHMLTRTSSASFYAANVNWAACNAQDWPKALLGTLAVSQTASEAATDAVAGAGDAATPSVAGP